MAGGTYSSNEIFQMMGRAGRPRFDTTGRVVIMTTRQKVAYYEQLSQGQVAVESKLQDRLATFLCSEIVLGTIPDVSLAFKWLETTFLFQASFVLVIFILTLILMLIVILKG